MFKAILTGNRCKVVPTFSKYEYTGKGLTIEEAIATALNHAKQDFCVVERATVSIYQRHCFKWLKIVDLEV